MTRDFDAVLFDAGGVLVVPDPTVLAPLLSFYGATSDLDLYIRAHYRAMAVKSEHQSQENDWSKYNDAYVEVVGVHEHHREEASYVLNRTRSAHLWRYRLPGARETLQALHDVGVPIGIVSNATGQIEQILGQAGVCQVGLGNHAPVRCIVDSHIVGVAKPDPRIFDYALPHFEGIDKQRIAYVGDSLVMDVGGSRAAGLRPILLDPYHDSAHHDVERISSLDQLLTLIA
jgi:putative hydrolase of the HAD superfamily